MRSTQALRRRIRRLSRARPWILILSVSAGGILGYGFEPGASAPQERNIEILARSYAFDPPVLRVNLGDQVRLRFASLDVVHGFRLEGYDLDVEIQPMRSRVELRHPGRDEVETVEEVVFTADRVGKFRYRCSRTCGFMHPFMVGELIVDPNRLFPTTTGISFGLLIGAFLAALVRPTPATPRRSRRGLSA